MLVISTVWCGIPGKLLLLLIILFLSNVEYLNPDKINIDKKVTIDILGNKANVLPFLDSIKIYTSCVP